MCVYIRVLYYSCSFISRFCFSASAAGNATQRPDSGVRKIRKIRENEAQGRSIVCTYIYMYISMCVCIPMAGGGFCLGTCPSDLSFARRIIRKTRARATNVLPPAAAAAYIIRIRYPGLRRILVHLSRRRPHPVHHTRTRPPSDTSADDVLPVYYTPAPTDGTPGRIPSATTTNTPAAVPRLL